MGTDEGGLDPIEPTLTRSPEGVTDCHDHQSGRPAGGHPHLHRRHQPRRLRCLRGGRYTTQVPDDGFTKGVESVAKALAEDGFVPVSWKNTFGKPGYQGINSAWRSPDGQVFELQFHTPASFEAKMTTHELYELARLPNTTPTERARLEAEMQRLFGSVPTPPGVRSITSPEVR